VSPARNLLPARDLWPITEFWKFSVFIFSGISGFSDYDTIMHFLRLYFLRLPGLPSHDGRERPQKVAPQELEAQKVKALVRTTVPVLAADWRGLRGQE
jgi:hypothetical protein